MAELSVFADGLRAELMRLRDLAGLSGRALGERIGVSYATVQRIEYGKTVPTVQRVQAWLTAVGADASTRARVLALAESARGETRRWGELRAEHLQVEMREEEAAARLVRNFQPSVVPGLLQTAEYARSLFSRYRTQDVPAAVTNRLQRQQALLEPGRRFEFLLTEAALAYTPGPRAWVGQIDHMLSLATLEWVELAVLPSDAPVPPPLHNFILNYPATEGAEPFVVTELYHGTQRIVGAEDVDEYCQAWTELWAAAAVGPAAREYLVKRGR